ncbi:MAG TPA: 1-(5-phosphoribosyl)-5-[(5-phosphoribosylamino)methylideneamino]imidazole-4-carboxamide isomerase, partial [Flavobacteriales bacterium]|nr:1-(5-phosphoribosyl)-5-[(5-phosphoribosylamino)methylideneamino]imidazole-4-carboxamide isomerase [Flavobacteriales bacterium]
KVSSNGEIFYFYRVKVIPAIDIIDGKCVRLTEGDYSTQKIYSGSPLDVAREFEDNGIRYLHLVDLDGARLGKITNWKVLESIAVKTSLEIDFGGGLKTDKDLEIALNSGARKVTGGSIAVKNPDLFKQWITLYPNRIILGADVKNNMVAVNGWTEESAMGLDELLDTYLPLGLNEVICTDISKDGKLQGLNIELYKNVLAKRTGLELIASGGVAGMRDVELCKQNSLAGVIIGKAIYEGKISLKELKTFIEHVG